MHRATPKIYRAPVAQPAAPVMMPPVVRKPAPSAPAPVPPHMEIKGLPQAKKPRKVDTLVRQGKAV